MHWNLDVFCKLSLGGQLCELPFTYLSPPEGKASDDLAPVATDGTTQTYKESEQLQESEVAG